MFFFAVLLGVSPTFCQACALRVCACFTAAGNHERGATAGDSLLAPKGLLSLGDVDCVFSTKEAVLADVGA